MRSAVYRPGIPAASPRVAGEGEVGGVPRRDIPGRIHISITDETAGRAAEVRLALARSLVAARAPFGGQVRSAEEFPGGQGGGDSRAAVDPGQPRVRCAGGGELSALRQIARRALAAPMPLLALLGSEVPYVPGLPAVVPQHRLLGTGRDQAVWRHTNTVATDTDISGEVKRRSLFGLKSGVWTPRSW